MILTKKTAKITAKVSRQADCAGNRAAILKKCRLRNGLLRVTSAALMGILLLCGAPARAAAYTPANDIVRIGLYYGSNTLISANLQNVDGFGSGYEFGYFDPNTREFISIGATTAETKISMLRDRNMYYQASGNQYVDTAVSDIIVGCFHVQLPGTYSDFASARTAASQYTGGFAKYDNGVFVACYGDYTTRDAANTEAAKVSGATVTAGTEYTISIAATGTGRVLFEFDGGSSRALGVRPISVNGVKPKTWFKGQQYYGAFQYYRVDGQNLRVLSILNVDDYIRGVLPQEMSPSWPLEALKAQALCARTYAISKLGAHGSSGFDLCPTTHCQMYVGVGTTNDRINQAVDETAGEYITYNGVLCETYYGSSNGGASENIENVWTQPYPYLRGKIDPYEADLASRIPNYNWTVTYTPADLTTRMRNRGISCGTITSLTVTQFTPTGNVLAVTMKDANGKSWTFRKDEVRIIFGTRSLRFTIGGGTQPGAVPVTDDGSVYANGGEMLTGDGLYVIDASGNVVALPPGGAYVVDGSGAVSSVGSGGTSTPAVPSESSADGKINGVFTIRGTGWGHNVGMSQWGAYAMAERGLTYRDIINFYYTGVEIG